MNVDNNPLEVALLNEDESDLLDSSSDRDSLESDDCDADYEGYENSESEEGSEDSENSDDDVLSGEEFLVALQEKVKSRPELFALDLETWNSLFLLALILNAARRYPFILNDLSDAIKAIQYLRCVMPEILIDIVALDGATVKTEGLGITTTLACLLSVTAFFLISYEALQYAQTRELSRTIKESARFMHSRQRRQYELLALREPHLLHLQRLGFNKKAINTMTVADSRWRSFTHEISAFNVIIGKYTTPIALASSIVGFVIMCLEAEKMRSISGCGVTDLITDECPVLGRYDIMATEIFPWIAISAGTLGFYSLSLSARLLAFRFANINAAGHWLHQKVHIPYTQYFNLRPEDEDKWTYQNLFWDILFYPLMLGILTYSILQAYTTANAYEDEIGCEHLIPFVGLILSNEKSPLRSCSAAQMILSIIGFLSDLELSKVYPMYLVAKNGSYGLGWLYGRYRSAEKRISEAYAKSLHNTIMWVHQNSQIALMSAVILTGLPLIYFARNKADETLQNGLEVVATIDFSSIIAPYLNQTEYGNLNFSTLISSANFKGYLHDICPYDDLMPLVSQTIKEFPQLINNSFPLTVLSNSSISYLYGKNCPGDTIFTVYIRSLLGMPSACNPLVEARSVSTFIGIYWSFISGIPVSSYVVTSAVLFASLALKLCQEKKPKEAIVGVEMQDIEPNDNAESVRSSSVSIRIDRNRLFADRASRSGDSEPRSVVGVSRFAAHARTPLLRSGSSLSYGSS